MRADGKMADSNHGHGNVLQAAFDDDGDSQVSVSGLSNTSEDGVLVPTSRRSRLDGGSANKNSRDPNNTPSASGTTGTATPGMITFGLQDAASRSFLLVNSSLFFHLISSLCVMEMLQYISNLLICWDK